MPKIVLYFPVELIEIRIIQEIIAEHQLKLLIFEAIKQEIVLWKE
jgi:hypothetical protein